MLQAVQHYYYSLTFIKSYLSDSISTGAAARCVVFSPVTTGSQRAADATSRYWTVGRLLHTQGYTISLLLLLLLLL